MSLPPIHDRFIETVKTKVQRDPRFLGLLAGGSMVTGTLDDFSDLDLILHREHGTGLSVYRPSVDGR